MTESISATTGGEQPSAAPNRENGDSVLAALASLVQREGGEVGITVIAQGAVVSGVLTSRQKWLELTASGVDQDAERFFRGLQDGLDRVYESEDRAELHAFDYLHLRDARVVQASGLFPPADQGGMVWRCRVSQVGGWAFGSVTPA
jgi:hypothetical protein